MKEQKNFGLSGQEAAKETYDNFKLGKNWDLGFISKEGIELRREQKRAETDSTNAQTAAMQQILSEPTQQEDGGMDAKTALAITVIVVAGLLVGFGMMNKRRKAKQATVQESLPVATQII